jgi:hypothetical protein
MPAIAVGGGGVSGLQLYQTNAGAGTKVRLMCLCADGDLVVWDLTKRTQTLKVSISPAVHTMHGSASSPSAALPTLARSFLETSKEGEPLVLILLQQPSNAGGGMQGFFYDSPMAAWLRVSDGRFAASDFYSDSTLRARMGGTPSSLSKIDSFVGKGVTLSAAAILASSSDTSPEGRSKHHALNRSHCEDKLACAVALKCSDDYQYWLGEYCKFLAAAGDEQNFRTVIAELLHGVLNDESEEGGGQALWWLSDCALLGLDRMKILKEVVLTALTTNRALQPLVGELQAKIELIELQ